MNLPLTRRGWALAGLLAVLTLYASRYGARSLNAVVAPGLVALVGAALVVRMAAPPTVERRPPPDGFPGESHAVELHVSGDRLGVYTVCDGVPDELTATPREQHVAGDVATVEYELRYDRRGAFQLDPIEVAVTDVLGLARREFEVAAGAGSVLVYPELVAPPGRVLASLDGVRERQHYHGRDEFDSLREYDRGDALRDVHWKSSAKRPDDDLVVKEFFQDSPEDAVGMAVGARGSLRTVDAAASAAASIATHLLEEGVEVGVETPGEHVPSGTGGPHHRDVLAALARLSSGSPHRSPESELLVTAADGAAAVVVDGQTVPFDDGHDAAGGRDDASGGRGSDDGGGPDDGSGDENGGGDDGRDGPGDSRDGRDDDRDGRGDGRDGREVVA